jgi:heat shock protein HslJ
MKKRWLIPAAVVFFCLSSCAGGPSFSSVQGKQWKLVEVKADPAKAPDPSRDPIQFDRAKLKTEGMDDIFVLTFGASAEASGKAAPETYTASYEQGAGQSLSLAQVRSDHAERDLVPERLRETDYFAFLEKISRWGYDQGKLELYSTGPDGQEAVLIFTADK